MKKAENANQRFARWPRARRLWCETNTTIIDDGDHADDDDDDDDDDEDNDMIIAMVMMPRKKNRLPSRPSIMNSPRD